MTDPNVLHLLLHVYLRKNIPDDSRGSNYYNSRAVLRRENMIEEDMGERWFVLSERGKKFMEMILDTPLPLPVIQKTIWVDPRETK